MIANIAVAITMKTSRESGKPLSGKQFLLFRCGRALAARSCPTIAFTRLRTYALTDQTKIRTKKMMLARTATIGKTGITQNDVDAEMVLFLRIAVVQCHYRTELPKRESAACPRCIERAL